MAGSQYYGTIDPIAKAYQNDPRTKLAAQALAQGTSTAPVAQGGWGVTDGLARAAQAILGAVETKNNDKKYAAREHDFTYGNGKPITDASGNPVLGPDGAPIREGGLIAASKQASAPQGLDPALASAAGALGGGQPAPLAAAAPIGAPQMPPGAPPAPQMAPAPAGMPQGAPPAPVSPNMAPPQAGAGPGFPAGGTGPNRGAPALPAPGADGVVKPVMEAVPNAPPPPPAVAPTAPTRPGEVQSNRIGIAQKLLDSGNPDLVAIAQTYLDKGLDEQNTARLKASDQQFAQDQTGYEASLRDYGAARSDARQDAYTGRREATARNFDREQTYGSQKFQAGQAGISRSFQRSERQASQAFSNQQRLSEQGFRASESDKERQNRLDVAGIRKGPAGAQAAQRSAYFNTPTGLKMQQAAGQSIKDNNVAIGKYQRFLDLNEKQATGGAALNTPGIAASYRWFNNNLTEMNGIANDTTLAKIGGSLGTAISDGDRKFITDSNISTSNPHQANVNMARATIGALRRQNDYAVEFGNAQADGTQQSFPKDWEAFVNSTPLVKYDRKGNAVADDKPVTFSQWKASRPAYDANGNKVK